MAIEVVKVSPKHWIVLCLAEDDKECRNPGHGGHDYPHVDVSADFRTRAAANHLASWLRDQPGRCDLAVQHYNLVSRKPTRWACGCEEDEDGNVLEKCDYEREAEVARSMENGD